MKVGLCIAAVLIGAALVEVDLAALRIPLLDLAQRFHTATREPTGCTRLLGPIGAEDAVVLPGDPPILILGELDAAALEFTTTELHGASASTSPRGRLWALELHSSCCHIGSVAECINCLTPLEAPLPDGVGTMHTHGLGLHKNILFAVNHAFGAGGERIERWLVTRRGPNEGRSKPPLTLTHLDSVTGHEGAGEWSFTSRLNGGINAVAPVSSTSFFFTQFVDLPVAMEGAASGSLAGNRLADDEEDALTRAMRSVARALGVEIHAKVLLPRLRRTRIFFCRCAVSRGADHCVRTECAPAGPRGATWNGLAYVPHAPPGEAAVESMGRLYANDIFLRTVTEFAVDLSDDGAALRELRVWRAPYLVDNVDVESDSDGQPRALWVGAVGLSHREFFSALGAMQANASAAHAAARASGTSTPRPHRFLRPDLEEPPQPSMASGVLHIDLETGAMDERLLQTRQLAAISWGREVGAHLYMGSPWDDGVLVCPLHHR